MDRFDDIAREKLENAGPCEESHRAGTEEGGLDLPRSLVCEACAATAIAEALREADREGAKRARREALVECLKICEQRAGYAIDYAAVIRELTAKEEEEPR